VPPLPSPRKVPIAAKRRTPSCEATPIGHSLWRVASFFPWPTRFFFLAPPVHPKKELVSPLRRNKYRPGPPPKLPEEKEKRHQFFLGLGSSLHHAVSPGAATKKLFFPNIGALSPTPKVIVSPHIFQASCKGRHTSPVIPRGPPFFCCFNLS